MSKRIAISGAANCTYPEFKISLDKVLKNILKDKPVLVFRLPDAQNATHYADDNHLCYEIQFTSDNTTLVSEADCVFVFWDKKNPVAAFDTSVAKQSNKQLRVHTIQNPVDSKPIQITDLFSDWAKPEEEPEEVIQYNLFER